MTPLLVSTRNAHKISEMEKILGKGFSLLGLDAIELFDEVEETGTTFEANATLKALAASQRFEGWVIADDSGLEVDALNGAPGIFSARFAGKNATDASNNSLLLEKLSGQPNRCARFRCVIALAREGVVVSYFDGHIEGHIAESPSGAHGFGYDPIFIPKGYSESFASLPSEVKNTISHRACALALLTHFFAGNAQCVRPFNLTAKNL